MEEVKREVAYHLRMPDDIWYLLAAVRTIGHQRLAKAELYGDMKAVLDQYLQGDAAAVCKQYVRKAVEGRRQDEDEPSESFKSEGEVGGD